MRKILLAISVLAVLTFALAVNAAAPTNFAGTWTLDKTKSQGLSQRMQGADVSWVITQADGKISVETKITGGTPPAGGGGGGGTPPAGGPPGGGGRGGGGGGGFGGPQSYNLDGSESTADMGQAKATRKATWSGDGKTLELWSKTTRTGQDGNEVSNTSDDKLSLSGDGKVLTVVRHSEGGRGGPQDSTLVFNK